MGCIINSPSPTIFLSTSSSQPKFRFYSIIYSSEKQGQPISTTTTQNQASRTNLYSVKFQTLGSCKLGISRYPDFEYNAEGGIGSGTGTRTENNSSTDDICVSFNLQTLYIPPLTSAKTRFLGLPLPPFLKIDITPELFGGTINQESGKVDLEFKAKFWFSVGKFYRAPPLVVQTVLTSEESIGTMRMGKGERLDTDGRCRLVGVATVDPIDDVFMNFFLGLPSECLANLNAMISLSDCT